MVHNCYNLCSNPAKLLCYYNIVFIFIYKKKVCSHNLCDNYWSIDKNKITTPSTPIPTTPTTFHKKLPFLFRDI